MLEKGNQPTEEEEEIKIKKEEKELILPPLEQKKVGELPKMEKVKNQQVVKKLVHQNLALKKEELGNKFKNINTQHLIWNLMLIQIFGVTLFLKDRK